MAERKADVTIVSIDLSFHRAATGVIRAVLEKHGLTVFELRAPHKEAFALLQDGSADILCSAWLPGSHGVYFDEFSDQLEKLTVLYTPYALWGVPSYVPDTQVSSIHDLTKPEVSQKMRKTIQGIGPGAGISRFSREILDKYGLASQGYRFLNGTLDDCVSAFEDAVQRGEWVVVPLWQPQFLFASHRIRELKDPLGLLRGKDEATLIIRRDRLERVPADALTELRGITLGNEAATQLDYLVSCKNMTPYAAGKEFLGGYRPESR
ncbi:glycine betaine ABC transporter substrate-binding protein [Paraburkholderia caribensis]|uniref:glycine betaine ABC transporter substrate-binding protein n=1 Tax=Paraburkholderia caribensis TaxID=75105 RepID=UPI0015911A1A|nr:glycine betaine ABC transporter substrate-binding protein [Paraburkholderia caribensis]